MLTLPNRVELGNANEVYLLSGRLRQVDIDECRAFTGQDPEKGLIEAWCQSVVRYCIWRGDRVAACFGLVKRAAPDGYGVPWLLGSDLLGEMKRYFMRITPTYLSEFLNIAPTLYNYVDARNEASIRWLKWAGFRVHDPIPMGPGHRPFHPIVLTKKDFKCATQQRPQ